MDIGIKRDTNISPIETRMVTISGVSLDFTLDANGKVVGGDSVITSQALYDVLMPQDEEENVVLPQDEFHQQDNY